MTDLNTFLQALDPAAPLAERHVWLMQFTDWLRGDRSSAQSTSDRLLTFIEMLDAQPELAARFRHWWRVLDEQVDTSILLADFGFAARSAFFSELADRIGNRLLPKTPETTDAAQLFDQVLSDPSDASWIEHIDARTLRRLAHWLSISSEQTTLTRWQEELLQALQYCGSQIRAAGLSAELRKRMDAQTRQAEPFHGLATDVEALCRLYAAQGQTSEAVLAAAADLKIRLEACRSATQSVYLHLEDNGISIDLVFVMRQMRLRLLRMRELLDCLMSEKPEKATVYLIIRLLERGKERRSITSLFSSTTSLLAAKMAERSAETGEHYITRNTQEYKTMLKQAAGGGAVTALTTWAKFALGSLGLVAFWGGFAAGLMYAASFVLIQLMHWTLATKQPAATAPAMAAKLRDIKNDDAVEAFTDEVSHLIRSQVAAVVGNVGLVAPVVILISAALYLQSGLAMISAQEAREVLGKLHLLHPSTLLFAAFTGVLLFLSSLVAGWAENWFVLNRLDSAIRYNPRIQGNLGSARALRWAGFMRRNISGFAGNISLGLMLGIVPVLAAFFGIGLDVRHVTLSMGQLSAALAALAFEQGLSIFREASIWWCLLAIPMIGLANLSVSFFLAFQLASRAHVLTHGDRKHLRQSLWRRLRQQPASFFLPRT